MSKELVVSSNRHETRVAVLEDDLLTEIYFQRQQEYSLAGSIHKGRVTRVLPGMQSAFVDIGLERDAFLYVSDFFEDNEEYDQVVSNVEEQVLRLEKAQPTAPVVRAEPVPALGVEPPAVGNGAAPPVERPMGAAPAPDRDGRERRGRRPRRRRGKGRGFPDSKYASPTAPLEIKSEVGELSEAVEIEEEELPMLPGESISKYSQSESELGLAEEDTVEQVPDLPKPEVTESPVADPPVAQPEIAAAPVAIASEPEVVIEPEPVATVEQVPDLPEPLLDAEIEPETESAQDENLPEEVEPARIPTSLTAQLREQGSRYPHRVSRRARRKMRGPGDSRPEGFPQGPRTEIREALADQQAAPKPERERPPQPSISDLLREGQEIIVQIAKEPLGQKGARITSYVALPGRFVVYMPTVDHVGVSRKIASDEERQRLKRILQSNRTGIPGGFILRTAGEGKSEEELRADMHFLYNLWMDLRQKAEKKKAPVMVHHDLDLVQRILRDQLTSSFKNVWVDNEEMYADVVGFVQRFQPGLVSRVKLYTRPTPIFDAFNITAELEKALRPKVWLKTGGYIVINQTEALVAIDINTGKYVGKSNRLEDTIVKTNTDAVKEIVRQIRLRDLGGIIVVDFIDMDERKNRQKVMQALEEAMRSDRAPNKILAFNDFGLVAITRKRVKQSLERTMCSPCSYCEGAGYVKSVATVIGEILQEAGKIARSVEGREVLLRVHPEVAKVLKSHNNDYLQELEGILGRTVMVKSDPLLHQEKFDLA
jgi:Rne/Rng family ribonuclease